MLLPRVQNQRTPVSKYFRQYEVTRSATASRKGIDNYIYCPKIQENAEQLALNVLDPIREQFGPFGPSSWFRCEALERDITRYAFENWCRKNALRDTEESWKEYFDRKQHPKGCAADIEIVGVSNDVLFSWIKDNLEFDQLIREFPKRDDPHSGWVHVSWTNNNRNQTLTIY